jgi:TRAP-type C4-dicarboxylate transport system permease small subunit
MAMMFPITADVILRYGFRSPLHGSLELGEFMMIGIVYLSIAYIQAVKGHIRIEVGSAWLPKKFQIAMDIFGYAIGLALFSIIAWRSGQLAWEAWITKDYTMGVVYFPLWPAKSIVPIGTGLLCLRLLSDMIRDSAKLFRD